MLIALASVPENKKGRSDDQEDASGKTSRGDAKDPVVRPLERELDDEG